MVLFLKLLAADALEFIVKYWKQLLLLLLLFLFGMTMRSCGYNDADAKWVKYHNEQVRLHNKKVTKLEEDSKRETKALKEDAQASKWALQALAAEFPPILAKDKSGKKLMCDNKPVSIYLGSEFTDAWNELTKAGELK